MTRGATRAWLPPQREPGETAHHYVEQLNKTIAKLNQWIAQSQTNDERDKWTRRYGRAVKARDEAMLEVKL